MSSTADINSAALPTLERLGASVPPDLDVVSVAQIWFQTFANFLQTGDLNGILGQLVADAFWRDILAFTWDILSELPSEASSSTNCCRHCRQRQVRV